MRILLKNAICALCVLLCGTCISGCDVSQDGFFTDEAAVRDCHAVWFEGLVEENLQKLDGVIADDVTLSFPDGSLWKKPDFLEALRAGDLQYDWVNEEEELIRLYGRVGVVNGMATLGYTYRGESDEERLRYTAVYVSSHRGCTMVAWHSTDRGGK